jgi:hypothetical protein
MTRTVRKKRKKARNPMSETTTKPVIEKITILHIADSDCDTSWIGEYTNDLDDWNIYCREGEYVHDLKRSMPPICCYCGKVLELGLGPTAPELDDHTYRCDDCDAEFEEDSVDRGDYNFNTHGREYALFKPYAGGEEEGTENYRKYGKRDWKRMEGLCRGDWMFMGIKAVATVSYPEDPRHPNRETTQEFESHGLWGIESDSSKDYFAEVAGEELHTLKEELEKANVDLSNFDELAAEAKDNPIIIN